MLHARVMAWLSLPAQRGGGILIVLPGIVCVILRSHVRPLSHHLLYNIINYILNPIQIQEFGTGGDCSQYGFGVGADYTAERVKYVENAHAFDTSTNLTPGTF